MEPGFLHRTRWRSYEYTLVTILIAAAIAGLIRPIFVTSDEDLARGWGRAFADAHLSFDYYRNYLFPHAGFLLALYAAYWWINGYILPLLMHANPPFDPNAFRATPPHAPNYSRATPPHAPNTSRATAPHAPNASRAAAPAVIPGPFRIPPGKLLWLLSNIFLMTLLLGIANGVAFSYTDAPVVVNEQLSGIMIIGAGLHHVIPWVVGYLAYAAVRELTIRRMQDDPGSNTLLIQVSDKLSSFFLIYFSVGCILLNFDVLFTEFSLTVFYFLLLPPAILTAYSNIYWVFPQKKDGKLLRGWSPLARRRLLISIISWPIPFFYYGLADGHVVLPALISFWLAQLAITTPVSWYIYRRWKEKLFQLHGLQTALGQSEADLQFLRSQINPHFLFNVLNTLYGTALQEDASRTAAGVQRLGDMMRFMLHENHLQHIPMAKEVDYLKNYIALQELRTESSEAIHIETVIDETFPDFQIAPMLLIPFVENGFKHGISLREPSWIKLRLESQGNRILFEMRNSIHTRKGDDPEKAKSGIGLKNVLHRLKLLYPDRHEFYMHQDEKEFFVQLSIQP